MIETDIYSKLVEDALANREQYLSEARQSVVRWDYYDNEFYRVAPMYFEQNLRARGQRIDESTASTSPWSYAYGFDQNGHLRYVRRGNEEEGIERDGSKLINRRYNDRGVYAIEELVYEQGMPSRFLEFKEPECYFKEEYIHRESRLVHASRFEQWPHRQGTRAYEYDFAYNADGRLQSIKQDGKVMYQALTIDEAAALRQEVFEGLVQETERTILRFGDVVTEDELCFVGIWIHGEAFGILNPIFYGGVQRIREQQLADGDELGLIWSAAEHPDYTEALENPALEERFSLLLQYWKYHSGVPAKREVELERGDMWWECLALWHGVAMELNMRDWTDRIPATDTFVIFIDEEALMVVNGDLEHSVPSKKIRMLKEKGLL
ncbi:hypothetical protein FHS18_004338 [Paenibacillus phyllosphaerae]|uniref:Uncharacterized protein n=1 Tax=Paenibacillus phyllosphaerae TaxID=274593 RepID=A0A7W5B0Q6_9BACL|nr:hypothetical protein [Paenibacillus phyllosphaerae]MBB3112252.1 hypothetical protein [Paenibacillus phyllosphaerae]